MIDEAKRLKTRLLKSKDLEETFKKLEKDYDIVKSVGITSQGDFKQVVKIKEKGTIKTIVEIDYINRDDETDYKQYILAILY